MSTTTASRRQLLASFGMAGATALGAGLIGRQSAASGASAPFTQVVRGKLRKVSLTDIDLLNFALNLEYLEAEFYLQAAYGSGLESADTTGVGTLGQITGAHLVPFQFDSARQYAVSVAEDELAHVRTLRAAIPAKARVARPHIDFAASMTAAAQAAGLIDAGDTFDAFESDETFLLASFLIEDLGVSAYRGVLPFIQRQDYVDTASGIVAVEAYHAGYIRAAVIYAGEKDPSIIDAANAISAARAAIDGSDDFERGATDDDGNAIVAPCNANGLAFARSVNQVLKLAYLGAAPSAASFYPGGLNGRIA